MPLTLVPLAEPGVEDGPAAVGRPQQDRVQAGDAGVGGRDGQVDLGADAAGGAAPADPDLGPVQPEAPLGAVGRELDGGRVGAARRLTLS